MKKLIKLICIVSCLMICLSGCGNKKDSEYNEQSIKECFNSTIDYISAYNSNGYKNDDVAMEDGIVSDGTASWKELKDGCGEYSGDNEDYNFSVSNGEITVTQKLMTDGRYVLATGTFEEDAANENKMTMTSISFEPIYSTGEKLEQAAMNTLLGMGTVFLVLIFMSFIISCFKVIPKIINAREKKKTLVVDNKTSQSIDNEEIKTNIYENDTELVAVIAAAIAASRQVSTDSFVVRTIRRR